MIFNRPDLLTRLEVWWPRYNDQYTATGEKVALLHKEKVDKGTPWLIVEFTKAKHLYGQRFCIKRSEAQKCPVGSNGTAPMYIVPMSKLEGWDKVSEIKAVIQSFGW
jgi:hypothetical protein